MKRKLLIFSIIGALFLSSGCGKKAILRKYYILALTRPLPDSTYLGIKLQSQVDVRDFTVAKSVDQTRIAMRTNTHEMNYYFYHHWAVKPGAAVADMIYALLSDTDAFERLTRGYSNSPRYVISGMVDHIERLEESDQIFAHLGCSLLMIDTDTRDPVVTHHFDRKNLISPPKSMNAFAREISVILQEECQLFLKKTEDFLSQQ